jgi:hypothetical protein
VSIAEVQIVAFPVENVAYTTAMNVPKPAALRAAETTLGQLLRREQDAREAIARLNATRSTDRSSLSIDSEIDQHAAEIRALGPQVRTARLSISEGLEGYHADVAATLFPLKQSALDLLAGSLDVIEAQLRVLNDVAYCCRETDGFSPRWSCRDLELLRGRVGRHRKG